MHALRRRLAPADLLGHGIEHAEVARMLAHQLAPELELVLADRLGQLVHEALDEDAVLVDVHAAPEPGRTCGLRIAWSISRLGTL